MVKEWSDLSTEFYNHRVMVESYGPNVIMYVTKNYDISIDDEFFNKTLNRLFCKQ